MTIANVRSRSRTASNSIVLVAGLALYALPTEFATAQICSAHLRPTEASVSLPDAPGLSSKIVSPDESGSIGRAADGGYNFFPAPGRQFKLPTRRDMTVLPNQTAHLLSPHDKVLLGLKESVSIFSIVGWSSSAGFGQLIDSAPNYGTDKSGFGERLGATALRSVTENLFSTSLFAPLLHEDPRYYELGRGHSILKRVAHAAERPIITKDDSGRSTLNYSLFAGNLLGSALTNAYYPERNRDAGQTMQTFGTSIGGSAIGFVINEFLNDALSIAHLRKVD